MTLRKNMKGAGKAALILSGCFAAFVAAIPVYWHARHIYYEPRKEEAMRFCESLIPAIEASKKNGIYPSKIDPEWLRGKNVPELVRADDFYLANGPTYLLRIRNPGDFMEDIWGYHGTSGAGCWITYDGY